MAHICGGQRTTCDNQVPSSNMCFLRIKVRPGLVTRPFTHLAILPALHPEIMYYILSVTVVLHQKFKLCGCPPMSLEPDSQ